MPKAEAGPLQVKESFSTAFKGIAVTYRQGEAVHADDPVAKKWPEYFEPLHYVHDVATLEAGAPKATPEPEPEPEPEPDPLARQARAGGEGVHIEPGGEEEDKQGPSARRPATAKAKA